LTPDADEARRLLEQELSRPEYAQARGQNWFAEQFEKFINWLSGGIGPAESLSDSQLVAIAAVVVAVAAVAVWVYLGPLRFERRRRTQAMLDGEDRPAADLRAEAASLAAAADWTLATLQLFRAMVRSLSERAIIDETPGMTAHEAAHQAAARLPALAGRMRSAADVFDSLAYGNRAGSSAKYREMLGLDAELSAATPTPLDTDAAPPPAITVEAAP
jgi:hypothetical protein